MAIPGPSSRRLAAELPSFPGKDRKPNTPEVPRLSPKPSPRPSQRPFSMTTPRAQSPRGLHADDSPGGLHDASDAQPDPLQGCIPKSCGSGTADDGGSSCVAEHSPRAPKRPSATSVQCGIETTISMRTQPTSALMQSVVGYTENMKKSILIYNRDRPAWAMDVWDAFEHPTSGPLAAAYAWLMPKLICLSVAVTLMQSIEHADQTGMIMGGLGAAVSEFAVETIFLLELALRFAVCPNQIAFFMSGFNIIDILTVAPLAVRASVGFALQSNEQAEEAWGEAEWFVLLGVVPVLRLLKTLRHFEHFFLLVSACHQVLEALPVLLFVFLLITLSFSAIIFLVEDRDNIESLPKAMWLTIVTMTTVGYGDVTPQSPVGSLTVSVLIIGSVLYMAIPLGMVGKAFTDIWGERHRILLLRKLYDCVTKCGHTAADMPLLFQQYDSDGSGALDVYEFRDMIEEQRVLVSPDQAVALFEAFASDSADGLVNAKAFVRVLFPNAYHSMYGAKRGHQNISQRITQAVRSRLSTGTPSPSATLSDWQKMTPDRAE